MTIRGKIGMTHPFFKKNIIKIEMKHKKESMKYDMGQDKN